MDTLTHIVVGACIGEAFFEKGFGKKAMLWGALAQSIPDIDFVSNLWLNSPDTLLAHRGFTHSIFFTFLIVPIFSLTADKIHRPHNISFKKWNIFFLVELLFHLFLDAFNNYGIGWFEPFSHFRFSFNTIYVADPFFSIVPGISFIALIVLNRHHLNRKFWWKIAFFFPIFYLGYCLINKNKIDNWVSSNIKSQKINAIDYFTTPAPLQNFLWYVVVSDKNGYYVGYKSILEKNKTIKFNYFYKNDSLLSNTGDHEEIQKLKRFSKGYYTAEKFDNTIVFNDLRFGQSFGWTSSKNNFVFHYYINHPKNNELIIQRGRFSNWDWDAVKVFYHRATGG